MTFRPKAWLRSRKNKLSSFLRLSLAEKWLLINALFLIGAITLGLYILPFRVLRRLTSRPPAAEIDSSVSVKRLIWSVDVAGQLMPGAKCLARAMVAQVLLAEHGRAAQLRIGVAKSESQLQAHAWLEEGGRVLIGGSVGDYKPLPLECS
jgi:hypothetical protein